MHLPQPFHPPILTNLTKASKDSSQLKFYTFLDLLDRNSFFLFLKEKLRVKIIFKWEEINDAVL